MSLISALGDSMAGVAEAAMYSDAVRNANARTASVEARALQAIDSWERHSVSLERQIDSWKQYSAGLERQIAQLQDRLRQAESVNQDLSRALQVQRDRAREVDAQRIGSWFLPRK